MIVLVVVVVIFFNSLKSIYVYGAPHTLAVTDSKRKTTKKTTPKIVLWHQWVAALCRELRVTTSDYKPCTAMGCKTAVVPPMSNPVPVPCVSAH